MLLLLLQKVLYLVHGLNGAMRSVFSKPELNRRIRQIKEIMSTREISGLVSLGSGPSYYLHGIPTTEAGRPTVPIIPLDGESALICFGTARSDAQQHSWISDIREYTDIKPTFDFVVELMKEVLTEKSLDRVRIGIVPFSDLSFSKRARLEKELPSATFIDMTDAFEAMMAIKSSEEIKLLRDAAHVCDKGLQAAIENLKPGNTELELAAHATAAMLEEASRLEECPCIANTWIQSGKRTLQVHSYSTGKKIAEGELVQVNVVPELSGYLSVEEMSITAGAPTSQQKSAYEVEKEALQKAIDTVRPGTRVCDIDAAARHVFDRSGIGYQYIHGSGHELGLYTVEGRGGQEFRQYNEAPLKEGMVIAILPGFYVHEIGGFRNLEMVLVTGSGHEVLTTYNKEW